MELFGDHSRIKRLVRRLNYLTITRPNISYAISVVSQFMEAPRTSHWDAMICIIRYLLYRENEHLRIKGFTDADWTGSPSDKRSTTGHCTLLGDNLVSWKSKNQTVVARSSVEAEYRVMTHTTSGLIWLFGYNISFRKLIFQFLHLFLNIAIIRLLCTLLLI